MKVVHIESGLGNQMLSYCELLALKATRPDDEYYIETIVYDIIESHERICQWNGYELERIFGIHEKNISELFSQSEWKQILDEVGKSEFWVHNWNYPVYFTDILEKHHLKLANIRGNFETGEFLEKCSNDNKNCNSSWKSSLLYRKLKGIYYLLSQKKIISKEVDHKLFVDTDADIFTGQRLSFKQKGNGIEKIDKEIRHAFQFPVFEDKRDISLQNYIKSVNSVSIHARRGDMLTINGACYKNGYFKAAVKMIKKRVKNPVFLFFCDPGSIQWCKDNLDVFGLNNMDVVEFVDWHSSAESYRDMQIMALCKHNIITNSSFGWWGSYLNTNPDKITISPDCRILTTDWV